MEIAHTTSYWLTRFCFQRGLAFVYLLGFLIAVNQFRALIGEKGLLPAPLFLRRIRFWDAPSLFWVSCTNRSFRVGSWLGLFLSLLALSGFSDSYGMIVSTGIWALLWVLYLSFVNIGQTFYSFGWESLLLETGFLAIFLGPTLSAPPTILIWFLRWVLFRNMFGAGMIKLRGDPCWRDLTCMQYHYETQPLPNPLSWYLHRLPPLFHKAEVAFTHFVELIVPWAYFFPQPVCAVAGALTVFFQVSLIFSGNLSWLNYITIVLCIPCFDDSILSRFFLISHPPSLEGFGGILGEIFGDISGARLAVLIVLSAVICFLSRLPARNLFSRHQVMNASFEPFHLVNTYGAFGSVTRSRMEVIIQGTEEVIVTKSTRWREYEFKGKPGNVGRRPCIVSPYHYRLDWQMWFAAMQSYVYHPWILNLVAKLLAGDSDTLRLMAVNPFKGSGPPKYIRAELYLYRFANFGDQSGNWWVRVPVRPYLPPLSLEDPSFKEILQKMGWV